MLNTLTEDRSPTPPPAERGEPASDVLAVQGDPGHDVLKAGAAREELAR
ncbi:hypothetical protein ABZZ17_19985 [Streptomyces sp. NPDC006512]